MILRPESVRIRNHQLESNRLYLQLMVILFGPNLLAMSHWVLGNEALGFPQYSVLTEPVWLITSEGMLEA